MEIEMSAQILTFPIRDELQPRVYSDALFWEAVVDSYTDQMCPALARRLIADAPDQGHPLIAILKTFL